VRVVFFALLASLLTLLGCGIAVDRPGSDSLTAAQQQAVTNDVRAFMNGVAQDVSQNGVTAWRKHFEDTPSFFMAVNGAVAFQDSQSFTQALPGLTRMFKRVELKWNDVRIDPLTTSFAIVGSSYHEMLTGPDDQVMPSDGFFTALAQKVGAQWQFRNVHWSALIPSPLPTTPPSPSAKEK
jgi:hypothetical protein